MRSQKLDFLNEGTKVQVLCIWTSNACLHNGQKLRNTFENHQNCTFFWCILDTHMRRHPKAGLPYIVNSVEWQNLKKLWLIGNDTKRSFTEISCCHKDVLYASRKIYVILKIFECFSSFSTVWMHWKAFIHWSNYTTYKKGTFWNVWAKN